MKLVKFNDLGDKFLARPVARADQKKSGIFRFRSFVVLSFSLLFIILFVVFNNAQFEGGSTWDEDIHLFGIKNQLKVAYDWVSGDPNADFTRIGGDLGFYGIVSVFPAYVAEAVGKVIGLQDTQSVFRYTLHLSAFMSFFATLIFFYLILRLIDIDRYLALSGTGLLASYPLWLGYAFFDYKDVPTAAFDLMALYAAIALVKSATKRETRSFALLFALATILIAGTKIAALALIIPQWIVVIYVMLRRRHFITLASTCAASAVGVVIITPVAWSNPAKFLVASVELMSRHPWGGRVLSNTHCLDPHAADWSAAMYMYYWFMAQIPVLVSIGAVAGILLAYRRGMLGLLIAASSLVPLALIVANNSTLYDGLRHLLFQFPILFILAIYFFDQFEKQFTWSRPVILGLGILQAGIFLLDDVALFPYNYIYFNLPTRQFATDSNYESDYWGFSLKEAAELPEVVNSPVPVVGNPPHLISPFLHDGQKLISPEETRKLPAGTHVMLVSYTRNFSAPTTVPLACQNVHFVTRSLPFSGRTIRLSFAASCEIRSDAQWSCGAPPPFLKRKE